MTLSLIHISAYQLPDCLQVLSVGVLRGFRDTASITVITFFSYWIVGFPVCYIPVSYTHLDVYKRQLHTCRCA